MLPYFLLLSLVAADSFLDALKSAEKSSFRSDLERTKDFATALNLASVRRARRYNESLSSGRLTVGPVAHTIYGDLVGVVGGNVTQFLGVPFAQAPVGPLRWRSPLPPLNWGNRTAQWFGPTCPQTEANTWAIFTGTSEDCLNLNVYAPSAAPPTAAGYPVMVFFYGGSFTYGSAGFPLYDGWFDVSLLENTIIVAANYRLGVLGFMAGDALRSESADGSVGTYGFQDQIAALKFIQATASAFGGDATRVTIFGESAGAASVTSHLVGPKSAGFFSRAIIESGAFSVWTAQPWNISRTRLSQFSANVGCTSAPDLMGCLRALNTTEILKGDRGLTSGFLEWSPTIDGVYVLDDPRLLLKAGKAADVPVMMGFNADEGSLFVRAPKDLNESGYQGAIASILNPQLAAKVADFYPCKNYKADLGQSDCWWALAAIERDCMFACPVQTSAAILAQQSGRVNAAHTYAYFYTQVLFILDIVDLFKPYRCFHGSELPSVFNLWPALWGEGEAAMAQWFVGAWTNFAATGDPNFPGAPGRWDSFGASATTLVVSTGAGGPVLNNSQRLFSDACTFWAANPVPESVIWG